MGVHERLRRLVAVRSCFSVCVCVRMRVCVHRTSGCLSVCTSVRLSVRLSACLGGRRDGGRASGRCVGGYGCGIGRVWLGRRVGVIVCACVRACATVFV